MEGLESFLERFPQLTVEQKLEVVNHRWLFVNAPESSRAEAMMRLNSLLEGRDVNAETLMRTLRAVALALQEAIEEQISKSRLLSAECPRRTTRPAR